MEGGQTTKAVSLAEGRRERMRGRTRKKERREKKWPHGGLYASERRERES